MTGRAVEPFRIAPLPAVRCFFTMTDRTHTRPLATEAGKVKNPKANAAQRFFSRGRGGWVVSWIPFKSYNLDKQTLAKLDWRLCQLCLEESLSRLLKVSAR